MKQNLNLITINAFQYMIKACLLSIVVGALTTVVGCTNTEKKQNPAREPQPSDTLYTQEAAMRIYGYQPERALQIVDSAVIVGHISEWRADQCRARIYSLTQMYDQADSLLGGPKDVRLEKARVIGERLLSHDSIKADKRDLLDVLEVLSYTARMQNDTARWIQRSHQYVDLCHQMGPSQQTNALRTEAEIGAALCTMGHHDEGMAKLDSVIYELEATFHNERDRGAFNELDALIIAMKRKIVSLGTSDRYTETLPLARLILEHLDDYELHPDNYHDGSDREPETEQERADYIRFYRRQAQNYIAAAYASLGDQGNMIAAFEKIEEGVRKATVREHIAYDQALQQRIEAEHQREIVRKVMFFSTCIGVLTLLLVVFVVVVVFKNRAISRKNKILAQQIAETANYREKYWENKRTENESQAEPTELDAMTDEHLFQYINDVIVREQLFLNPHFERQTIMDRFHLSKERVGTIFSKGSKYAKLSSYLQALRLDYSAVLLVGSPEKSIVQVATESGFSSNTYFCSCFRQHFSMSPSDFRKNALK